MKKILLILMFVLVATSVLAISFYSDTSFKGYGITNVSSITFSSPSGNITGVDCITYASGGMDCSR